MTGASAVLVRIADRIEITRDIAASPEAVYDAISDVTRMGEWSEECHACEWHDGVEPGSGIADRDGRNRQTMSGTLERLAAALEA